MDGGPGNCGKLTGWRRGLHERANLPWQAASPPALSVWCTPLLNNLRDPSIPNSPYLKYIDYFGNLDASNYNGLQVALTARNFHGLTLTTGYTYSHALGESSDQGTSGGLVIPRTAMETFDTSSIPALLSTCAIA